MLPMSKTYHLTIQGAKHGRCGDGGGSGTWVCSTARAIVTGAVGRPGYFYVAEFRDLACGVVQALIATNPSFFGRTAVAPSTRSSNDGPTRHHLRGRPCPRARGPLGALPAVALSRPGS